MIDRAYYCNTRTEAAVKEREAICHSVTVVCPDLFTVNLVYGGTAPGPCTRNAGI
jgi:hypothetical protein